jgi:zeaxanthin glucosyltransferase
MAHFGILCPPSHGHLNPCIVLGKELKNRMNSVTFFNVIDCKEKVENAGLNFSVIGEECYQKGAIHSLCSSLGQSSEYEILMNWNNFFLNLAQNTVEELKNIIIDSKVDILIIDQIDIIGGTIADYLNIPFITVCNALHTNAEPSVPPPFTSLAYDNSEFGKKFNKCVIGHVQQYFKPVRDFINTYRAKWSLPLFEGGQNPFYSSSLAQITQVPEILDFPRTELEPHFHYTAPFRDELEEDKIDFPYHLLDGRPIIYISLGTLVNHRKEIFNAIAEGCLKFDYQLIIVTTTQSVDNFLDLPGNPLLLQFVPQNKVLKMAKLLITHAGANTVLDAVLNAVPIIAIPISLDQPGCAERIKWHKIGEVIPIKLLSAEKVEEAVSKVLASSEYQKNINKMQAAIMHKNGTIEACDIIEEVAESVLELNSV